MARKFCNKPFFIGIACLIIGLWTSPYFILGEDAHMRIHDNLDSNIAWYKVLKESGQLFAPGDAPIGQIINGELKRNAFYTEFYAMIALFMVFPPVIAYGLSQLITRLLAFIGMYLLLKDFIVKDERAWFIQIGTALPFSLIPYWPSGMLSILGMPLALWAFLHIRAGKAKWFHYLILTGLPFLSSFVLGFFYFLTAMGVVWLIDAIRTRKWNVRFLLAIVYMTGIYLLMDHRLVTSMLLPHEPTNRDVFYESKNSLAATFKLILKNYIFAHNQDRSVHDKLILPFSLLCLVYVIWKKRWKEEKLFLFLHFFHLALSAWYAFWFYEGWQPLKERVGILNSFNFSRFHYFSPVVVYALFALSLKILADAVRSWPFLGGERTERLGKAAAAVLILAQFLILVPYNEQIYYRHSPSFKQFYAEKQFQEIKAYIGKPAEDYRAASIGIHPAIAQYNGFYTLDTYNNIYPLSYKLEFRKIIERELAKDKTIRDYFDHWGGRCYIFTAELGKHYMFSKRSERVIKDLDLNTEQFKKMGGEYILSAVPILNAEENGLALEKVFEDDDSWWRIYLYRVNG
ncbi:DUF6044 family protein [Caldibacillus debilis]|uniref:DUF6044 family protein n=1 Tax=Caldibacillus debilis TaxID=301148 RepID=UPI000B5568BC|nr:DUF6044 family protein [Caldibacillus debilis]OUM90996.1 MAG: hypothetical protein BAA03_02345 [Caldibacillus debilis]